MQATKRHRLSGVRCLVGERGSSNLDGSSFTGVSGCSVVPAPVFRGGSSVSSSCSLVFGVQQHSAHGFPFDSLPSLMPICRLRFRRSRVYPRCVWKAADSVRFDYWFGVGSFSLSHPSSMRPSSPPKGRRGNCSSEAGMEGGGKAREQAYLHGSTQWNWLGYEQGWMSRDSRLGREGSSLHPTNKPTGTRFRAIAATVIGWAQE